jgi:hypothetical protein
MHRALHAQQQQLAATAAKGAGAAEAASATDEQAGEARLQLQLGFQELLQACGTLAAAAERTAAAAGAAAAAGGGSGTALAATLAGLGQVLGLAADAVQLRVLCLDDGCPAALVLAALVSRALSAAGRLAPAAAGSGVEQAVAGALRASAAAPELHAFAPLAGRCACLRGAAPA